MYGTWNRHGIYGGRFGWPIEELPEGDFMPLQYRFHRHFPWRRRRFW